MRKKIEVKTWWNGIMLMLPALLLNSVLIVNGIILEKDCTGYLKRAADANSSELAQKEMHTALTYIEENRLTSGYTSVLYKTPDDDIEFWYRNLKQAKRELDVVATPKKGSSLEESNAQSNVLKKLRETILDRRAGGEESVTCPPGLAWYPYNALVGFLNVFFIPLGCLGLLICFARVT